MKFKRNSSIADGTSFQGYVQTTFAKIVEVFGKSEGKSGDDKAHAEWGIVFDDGKVATIYDYNEPKIPKALYKWHIGGNNDAIVERVAHMLECTEYVKGSYSSYWK